MKPLLPQELPNFVKRFGSFIDAELRSIEILSPSTMKVTIACQDSLRDFDWLTLDIEFNAVVDAKIIDNSKLSHIDMSAGVTFLYEADLFGFGIGEYSTNSGIKNAITFIISSNIKYEEGLF